MAANEMLTRGYWTRERVVQIGAPIAMVTGVVLLILTQLVSTPRDGSGVERAVAPVAPTAAVRLTTPTVPPLPAEENETRAVAPIAPTVAPAVEAPAVEALPTLEPVNCAAPATSGEREACAARLAPAPAQAPPAGIGQGGTGDSTGGSVAQPAQAPVVSDLIPIPALPAPTAGVYSCAEVTSPVVSCRGARRP